MLFSAVAVVCGAACCTRTPLRAVAVSSCSGSPLSLYQNSISYYSPIGNDNVLFSFAFSFSPILLSYPDLQLYIYTGDAQPAEEILAKVKRDFDIEFPAGRAPRFVRLRTRCLAYLNYPVCTLLLQSLGSIVIAIEAFAKLQPDIMVRLMNLEENWIILNFDFSTQIDTTGLAFSLPVFKLFGCRVGCYVHYPTISTDMLKLVADKKESYNNSKVISSSTSFHLFHFHYFLTIFLKP